VDTVLVLGWVLVTSGIVGIFYKTAADISGAKAKARATQAKEGGDLEGRGIPLPSLDSIASLLKAPYGVGVALVLLGVVVLLADAGITVSFSPSPSPAPTPTK
jgi:hypothetical protein